MKNNHLLCITICVCVICGTVLVFSECNSDLAAFPFGIGFLIAMFWGFNDFKVNK